MKEQITIHIGECHASSDPADFHGTVLAPL